MRADERSQLIFDGFSGNNKGNRFPPAIIQQAIWLYIRFTLSLREVEDY
ncbi:MAG: hypothetical protein USCAAHI_00083 [Beijerinckiaceae bacterium]|nr:MAG: hypothetical protein USCAAHI_00083 [Beijerinckiaceae bacterium]